MMDLSFTREEFIKELINRRRSKIDKNLLGNTHEDESFEENLIKSPNCNI